MGEIADMMINGSMCPCGAFIEDGDEPGHPRYCSKQCERDFGGAPQPVAQVPKIECPACHRKVKITGISHHWRDVHGG